MDAIVSRPSLALVISSSNCRTRVSRSKEGPDIVWVDGGAYGDSISRDRDVVLDVLFEVIVTLGLDIWILSRAPESWKAAELGGLTVKETGSEEDDGSFTCRHNWVSSSSSWQIVVRSLRRSLFSVLRSTKNWATWCWTAWRYWKCLILANGKVRIRGFVLSSACSEFILSWLTWVVNRCSCCDTVGLLRSGEVLGHLVVKVRSILSCEVDASFSVSNWERYIVNNRDQFVGLNMGACGLSVNRRAVLR